MNLTVRRVTRWKAWLPVEDYQDEDSSGHLLAFGVSLLDLELVEEVCLECQWLHMNKPTDQRKHKSIRTGIGTDRDPGLGFIVLSAMPFPYEHFSSSKERKIFRFCMLAGQRLEESQVEADLICQGKVSRGSWENQYGRARQIYAHFFRCSKK